jgi:hypothetical protein
MSESRFDEAERYLRRAVSNDPDFVGAVIGMGQAYEINNQKAHGVMNKGSEDRITFIFDYVPPEQFAHMQREPQNTAHA